MDDNNALAKTTEYEFHPLMNPEWLSGKENSPTPYLYHKDDISRINRLLAWAGENNLTWISIKLSDYRDHLTQEGLAESSISSILSTIRASYRTALTDNDVLAGIRKEAAEGLSSYTDNPSVSDVKAVFDTIIDTVKNNIDPLQSGVFIDKISDRADHEHTWLTSIQVTDFLSLPEQNTMIGVRDFPILAYMVGMGMRESEVCALKVGDVSQVFGGKFSVNIQSGKGRKKRLIPYGKQMWIIGATMVWMDRAGISHDTEGGMDLPVFRGFHSRWGTIRSNQMSTRSIQRIVDKYQLPGIILKPHDLRRTYARLMYESGIDLERISQNMGHANRETTRIYIGNLSAESRAPGELFEQP